MFLSTYIVFEFFHTSHGVFYVRTSDDEAIVAVE